MEEIFTPFWRKRKFVAENLESDDECEKKVGLQRWNWIWEENVIPILKFYSREISFSVALFSCGVALFFSFCLHFLLPFPFSLSFLLSCFSFGILICCSVPFCFHSPLSLSVFSFLRFLFENPTITSLFTCIEKVEIWKWL